MPLGNMQQSLRTCWAPNQKGFPIPDTTFLLVPIMDIPKWGRKWHNNTQRRLMLLQLPTSISWTTNKCEN